MGSTDPSAASLVGPRARPWVGGVLLIVGIQCWLILGHGHYGTRLQRWLLVAALAGAIVPPIRKQIIGSLDRLRFPSLRTRWLTAIGMGLLGACYFPLTAWNQGRDFVPIWQDAQSYAIQVQMLAHGRLWMPQHPLPDFFDTFQMIARPVYASMYFPGASIFYLPCVWFGIPFWVIASILAGACVGTLYWIAADLFDGVSGILAGLLLMGLSEFRHISIMLLGHPAIILQELLMLAFWLAWRRNPSGRWAMAIGIVSGWAAITRPLDALIVAIPIGIDMLLRFRNLGWKPCTKLAAATVLGATPFLILQLIFNLGVTGSLMRTPFDLHANLYYPDTAIGFRAFDPSHRPASVLPQKQKFHDEWTIPAIQRHQPGRVLQNWLDEDLHNLAQFTLPHPGLLLLLPIAILGLANRRIGLVALTIPLYLICYSFYTFSLPHYALLLAPIMILLVLLGARELEETWPILRSTLSAFLPAAIAILAITQTHELNRLIVDQALNTTELRTINARLASSDVRSPAVVLFYFPPDRNPHVEPVYNLDVSWPDDAPIIRAHDLGSRNSEIFDYYAKLQPDRAFYRYDRGTASLTFLGIAKDLGHAN